MYGIDTALRLAVCTLFLIGSMLYHSKRRGRKRFVGARSSSSNAWEGEGKGRHDALSRSLIAAVPS